MLPRELSAFACSLARSLAESVHSNEATTSNLYGAKIHDTAS